MPPGRFVGAGAARARVEGQPAGRLAAEGGCAVGLMGVVKEEGPAHVVEVELAVEELDVSAEEELVVVEAARARYREEAGV